MKVLSGLLFSSNWNSRPLKSLFYNYWVANNSVRILPLANCQLQKTKFFLYKRGILKISRMLEKNCRYHCQYVKLDIFFLNIFLYTKVEYYAQMFWPSQYLDLSKVAARIMMTVKQFGTNISTLRYSRNKRAVSYVVLSSH